MKKKMCCVCQMVKPLSEFLTNNAKPDKKTVQCGECLRIRDNLRYKNQKTKRAASIKAYSLTEAGKAAHNRARKRWAERNTLARAAHIIVGNAVRDGKLLKPSNCSECGNKKPLEAHYDDYAIPLAVRWLCVRCHKNHHENNFN